MPEDSFEEKTEDPTPKRLEDARKEGNVARSVELNSVLILIFVFGELYFLSEFYYKRFLESISFFFSFLGKIATFSQIDFIQFVIESLKFFMLLSLPVMLLALTIGIISNLLQIGFLFTINPLIPKFDRLNPIMGFSNLFSRRNFVELIKNILKLLIIGLVAFFVLYKNLSEVLQYSQYSVLNILISICKLSIKIVFYISFVYFILALFDFWYQKFEHWNRLKMSIQEVKEEQKQLYGDPKVRSRIRSLQMEMARRRMMEEVPKATVVITNPTFIAIAIQYEQGMRAPIVVAKGMRKIAERIREIAIENNIPIVENKPLARALYDAVDISEEIPPEYYEAVAEIIAYVYKLKNKV